LGSSVAKDLFGDQDPLDKQIKIKKTLFNIIGVMKERGSSGMQNQDNQVFVPLNTAQKLLLGIDYISFARFKVDRAENVNSAMEQIEIVLRDRHKIDNPENDDFSVRSMAQGLDAITSITNALKMFLAAIAAIALIVGGVGIMNIMLAAVQERTREIGLRMAIGAKKRDITLQFLIESITITLFGGIIGIILGILISYTVAKVAQNMGYDWDFVISISAIIVGCVVSVGVGLLFGIAPAKRASKLDPIEALRHE
jgi:putative ABC transport system permease protein